MQFNVYSIKDDRVEEWSMPYIEPTDTHALRAFRLAYTNADRNNSLRAFPEDYTLHQVGTWDSDEGILQSVTARPLINARKFRDEETARNKEANENG